MGETGDTRQGRSRREHKVRSFETRTQDLIREYLLFKFRKMSFVPSEPCSFTNYEVTASFLRRTRGVNNQLSHVHLLTTMSSLFFPELAPSFS